MVDYRSIDLKDKIKSAVYQSKVGNDAPLNEIVSNLIESQECLNLIREQGMTSPDGTLRSSVVCLLERVLRVQTRDSLIENIRLISIIFEPGMGIETSFSNALVNSMPIFYEYGGKLKLKIRVIREVLKTFKRIDLAIEENQKRLSQEIDH